MTIINCLSKKVASLPLSQRRFLFRYIHGMATCGRIPILLVSATVGLSALGQSTSASLSGTVTDPTGAVVIGTMVVGSSVDKTIHVQQVTDGKGYFTLTNLPPGQYLLVVSHEGFRKEVIEKLTLNANDTQSVAIKLQVGSVTDSVTVADSSTLVNTSGAVSNVIDRQLIEDLPLDGRSIQSLITLSPGVQAVPVSASGNNPGQFSVNGMRSDMNYFTVDGVSGNFAASAAGGNGGIDSATAGGTPSTDVQGSFSNLVPLDDMQQIQIQTSSFAPEFGRNPGAQISLVTRSGQNKFHGSLFEYFRNDFLDAEDWFSDYFNTGKQALRYNDFGGA